jgi:hypothetical protein
MKRPNFNVPLAYEFNRKPFRLERSQFHAAALDGSLRLCQSILETFLSKKNRRMQYGLLPANAPLAGHLNRYEAVA